MPELPEVETIRRFIAPALTARTVVGAEVLRARTARRNTDPRDVQSRLVSRRVEGVDRHGKFMIISLDDGMTLILHLGMSGRLMIVDRGEPLEPHTNFRATIDSGVDLRFVDPRTFGFVGVFDREELRGWGPDIAGPDALEPPSSSYLRDRLARRRAPIKALLLDQRIVAGLGNIYADEILYGSGIHPARPGGSVTDRECARLIVQMVDVLEAALQHGGTSLADLAYLLPDGRAGENLGRLNVYGRAGHPCKQCGTPIERVVIRRRSSFFCERCQRPCRA